MTRPVAVLAVLLAAGSVVAQPAPVPVAPQTQEQKAHRQLEDAIEWSEIATERGREMEVRRQAVLAIKDVPDVRSWLVVVRLRMCAESIDADLSAAAKETLSVLKPPADPTELHAIITHAVDPACGEACWTLAKDFPNHPETKARLRSVLRHQENGLDRYAAQALKSLEPAKKADPPGKPEK